MSILISFIGPLRAICMAIDGILYSLLDNAYDLVIKLSTAELLNHSTIKSLTENLYIIFGVVAFFRLALLLVNAIIDPEKLNEKGKGLSNIFFRVVGMIILLAVTPFLFEMSYELQGKIVGADASQNIIFKTILGNNANIASSNNRNAGKALQNIALSSLITIDKSYLKNKDADNPEVVLCNYKKIKDDNGKVKGYDYTKITNSDEYNFCPLVCVSNGDGTCTPQGGYVYGENCDWANCQNAVDTYNEMYVNEDMSPSKLASYVGVSKKIEDEKGEKQEVYVYNYMFIITGVVGVAMTYIIISFAIDIAVRMFELVVLEILSPLFIATFVDPKSAQSGPFKNWLSAVGKSYASLYIKLAIIALMILLISIINQSKMFQSMGDVSGWAKIFMVIGLLIFAKKAPKWIGDMIGIKGDGGLGGLSIGKKLGGMALAGGLAKKAGEGLKKGAKGVLGIGAANAKNLSAVHRQRANDRKAATGHRSILGAKRALRNAENSIPDYKSIYAKKRKQGIASAQAINEAKAEEQQARLKAEEMRNAMSQIHDKGKTLSQIGASLKDASGAFKVAGDAKGLSGIIKAATDTSKAFANKNALDTSTVVTDLGDKIKNYGKRLDVAAFGNASEQNERADALEKAKNKAMWYTSSNGKLASSKDLGGLEIDGKKGFAQAVQVSGGVTANNFEDGLVTMGAKISGIDTNRLSYDGNNQLCIDGNVISEKDRTKYFDNVASNLTNSGMAHYQEMFNGVQSNSLSEFQNNQQIINDMISSMNSVANTINNNASKLNAFAAKMANLPQQGLEFDKTTGGLKVDIDGQKIDLNPASLNDIAEKMNANVPGSGADFLQNLPTDLFSGQSDYINTLNTQQTLRSQYANATDTINKYQARNDQLATVVDGIAVKIDLATGKKDGIDPTAVTSAGASEKLSREKGKIDKKVKAADNVAPKKES